METSFPCVTRIHCFWKTSSREMRPGATSSIRNQNGNRWRGAHRLPRDQKRVVCKNPMTKHCWSSSSTTKASSIKNLFLQVKPLIPHFTMQFWTDCYEVSGGFGQSCTGLENGCCSTIMSLHRVRSVCANFWLWRWQLCLITLLTPLIWRLRTSSCFPALRCPSKVHVLRTWMPSKIVWQPFWIDSTWGLCWLFPEALRTLAHACCSGWRLFWREIKKICLYLLFCLFSYRIHRTF